jgi:streptomycin 6-kinase
LQQLPQLIDALVDKWSLSLGAPIDGDGGSCAWVAPATRSDGTSVVLKISVPHWEGLHEIAGLRFWAGDPTVNLLEADELAGSMLLERCHPGAPLGTVPEPDQDEVVARLLHRLWRAPSLADPFRPLSELIAYWCSETRAQSHLWVDRNLVELGLAVFEELAVSSTDAVVIGTDIHAGNVLMAEREPWLVIDPKPFTGDRAFDATQHLLNCTNRLRSDPIGLINRFARLLDVDPERVRRWMFARLAAEPDNSCDPESVYLARLVR